jgi:hypothetical protein
LPKTAKDALKVAKTVIIEGAFDCLYDAFNDKLASIPFLKDLPVLQRGGKAKEILRELILKEMDKFIDGLRRARRNLILRRRMGIFDGIGDVIKKIPGSIVDVGKDAGKIAADAANKVVEAGKIATEATKKAAEAAAKATADAAVKVADETKKKAEQVIDAAKIATDATKKAAEAAGKGVVEAAEAVGKVVVSIKDLPKMLEGLIGGALLKALSNIACPVVARKVHHGLDIALKKFKFPVLPVCLHAAILAGCKKGVELAFKKQRILRRLSSLKRELVQF